MANIFQKIFLSKKQIAEINQKNEILQLVASAPRVRHSAYTTQSGGVARRFHIAAGQSNMTAERTFDPTRPEELQVHYTLHVYAPQRVKYATHSQVDKFAEQVYKKMFKIWEKSKAPKTK